MPIDDEELPDIDDIIDNPSEPYDPDDEDDEQTGKMCKRVRKYIKQHKITPKTYVKRKYKAVQELKEHLKAVDLLLLSEAYMKQDTFSGFVRKHDALRKGFLKALLNGMDEDAKIIIIQELLNELVGDTKPVEQYIW